MRHAHVVHCHTEDSCGNASSSDHAAHCTDSAHEGETRKSFCGRCHNCHRSMSRESGKRPQKPRGVTRERVAIRWGTPVSSHLGKLRRLLVLLLLSPLRILRWLLGRRGGRRCGASSKPLLGAGQLLLVRSEKEYEPYGEPNRQKRRHQCCEEYGQPVGCDHWRRRRCRRSRGRC